jgi:hypothetical protein
MNDELKIGQIEGPYDPLVINGPDRKEIFRITEKGNIFWHGRQIEGDDELRAACTEMVKKMTEYMQPIGITQAEIDRLREIEWMYNDLCQ